jgi:hypothetical protein
LSEYKGLRSTARAFNPSSVLVANTVLGEDYDSISVFSN